MKNRQSIVTAILGGVMVAAVLAVLLYSHRQAFFGTPAQQASAEAPENPNGLNIPSIEDMCKAEGATTENMKACQTDESSAAEFVIAWMGLNGFINNGSIDLDQIQLDATFPSSDPGHGIDPDAIPDPTDPTFEPNIDPATGEVVTETFDSPAQIALQCLSESNDWLKMHDCISRYDPSSRFGN